MPYIPPLPRAPQVICDVCGAEQLQRFIAKCVDSRHADDMEKATIVCQNCVLALPAPQAIAFINAFITPMNTLRFDDESKDLKEWLEVMQWSRGLADPLLLGADSLPLPSMQQRDTHWRPQAGTSWSSAPQNAQQQTAEKTRFGGLHRSAKH